MTTTTTKKESFTDYLDAVRVWIRDGGELPARDDDRLLADRRQSARNR